MHADLLECHSKMAHWQRASSSWRRAGSPSHLGREREESDDLRTSRMVRADSLAYEGAASGQSAAAFVDNAVLELTPASLVEINRLTG